MVGGQSSPFSPIKDDADFMMRSSSGEFDDWDAMTIEAQEGVMQYMNKPEPFLSPQPTEVSDHALGMSAYRDVSRENQAEPLAGLMSMAQSGKPKQRYNPYPVQQGLMNPWGG